MFSINLQDCAVRNRRSSGQAQMLSRGYATFSDKIAGAEQGNCRFLATLGNYSELYPAFLDIENTSRGVALGKYCLFVPQVNDCPADSRFREKAFGIKSDFLLGSHHSFSHAPQKLKTLIILIFKSHQVLFKS